MDTYEPTREELEAFIKRAGFTPGWRNLESWERRMATQACIELHTARIALQVARDKMDAEGYFPTPEIEHALAVLNS
jgi:hypothetical protein